MSINTFILEEPDVNSKIIGSLNKNDKVTVRSKIENPNIIGVWFKIQSADDKFGFVLQDKLINIDDKIIDPIEPKGSTLVTYDIPWGNYYALVIGNNNYVNLPPLETPINDAKKIGEILKEKYNFTVNILPDDINCSLVTPLSSLFFKYSTTTSVSG